MQSIREQFRVGPDGPHLNLLRWGDASLPQLVLLHGGGANGHWWDHIAPAFASRFPVVAPDFRGHGDSESPADLRVGAFNDDLEALLDHLGGEPPSIVGHSMGAHVAFDHAARHEVRSLVLLDPSRGASSRRNRRLRLALSFRRSYRSQAEAIDRYRFLPDAEHVSEPLRRAIAAASVGEDEDGRWGYKFDPRWFGLDSRPRPDAADVRCPTLVVRGGESGILGDEAARELCEELPKGELAVIERAGHHVQLDRPERVIEVVSDFLARH